VSEGVALKDVYKYVLRGITFETEGKGVYVLLGPNGSGKTTVLRLTAGILKPERGRVLVGGRDPYRDHEVKGAIAYVADTPLTDAFEKCASYLSFYLQTTPRSLRGDFQEAVSYFGLESVLKEPILKLSAGQRKRLELSKLLLRKAPYVLIDEPTANLDSDGRRRTVDLVRRLSKGSLTLLATHEIDLVNELEADVVFLRNGTVEGVYSYERFAGMSGKLQKGYLVAARLSWKPQAGDPRRLLGQYGSKVEVRKVEIDYAALLRSLGIDVGSLEGGSSISVVWVDTDASQLPIGAQVGAVFNAPPDVTIPISVELVVSDRATVLKLVEDLMSKGEVEDLRVSRVV
jgi:ABC-type multidrug transport system ATPase subunit